MLANSTAHSSWRVGSRECFQLAGPSRFRHKVFASSGFQLQESGVRLSSRDEPFRMRRFVLVPRRDELESGLPQALCVVSPLRFSYLGQKGKEFVRDHI